MAEKKSKIQKPFNAICEDCLFWHKFGEKCHFHWKRKKFCTQRVETSEQKEEQKRILE